MTNHHGSRRSTTVAGVSVGMTGDAVATGPHQEVEVRPLVGLKDMVKIEADPSPFGTRRGGNPVLSTFGQGGFINQEIESTTMGIEMDQIAGTDQSHRTTDGGFGGNMEDARSIAGPTHPGVGDADHVSHTPVQQNARNGDVPHLREARISLRSRAPYHQDRVFGHGKIEVVTHAQVLLDTVEHEGGALM